MTKDSSFEVSFSLAPAVRSISRPPRQFAPTVPIEPKYTRIPRITQVLALALQLQDTIDGGEVKRHADIARLGCVSRERVSQIMMLIWLAPDVQHAVLNLAPTTAKRLGLSETALRSIARHVLWEDQRARWNALTGPIEE